MLRVACVASVKLTTCRQVKHSLSKCGIPFQPPIHACGLRQQRRSLEGGKHPCRCKMPQVIQSEDVYAIRQSNDVLTDVQAKAEKTVVPCPDGERMTKHHAVLVRLNLVA